jgi:hypothetical protein
MSIPTYKYSPSIKIGYDILFELHEFTQGNCYVSLRKVSNEEFNLETFRCNKTHSKGEGRQLLLYVLNWVKENYKDITNISLTAVPEILDILKTDTLIDREKKQYKAMLNLSTYYTSLGFKQINEEDFNANIDDIIEKINGYKRGGRRKKKTISKRRISKRRISKRRISKRRIIKRRISKRRKTFLT